jgi:hypothetical protein
LTTRTFRPSMAGGSSYRGVWTQTGEQRQHSELTQ